MTAELDLTNLPPGTMVGPYRLDGKLGKGGMGTVYLAEQTTIGRKVAVKILHSERVRNPERVAAFLQEARLAASLHHHGLVTIHDVGKIDSVGIVFYTMDYIHGRTLHMQVAQEGPLPAARARDLATHVADALGHAHRQGLIHRDIKPENILTDDFGQAKITDLGLATDKVNLAAATSSRTLRIVGTPGWSAPEQLRNPERVTPASDIFSLGCLYYFLLVGEAPFSGETLLDMAVRVCTEPPRKFHELPGSEQFILEQLMAKQPEERPKDGLEAAELLRTGGTAVRQQNNTSSRIRRPRRRRR